MADMIRPSQDPKFGDYQANFAMPLGKRLDRPPREVATEIVERLNAATGSAKSACHPKSPGQVSSICGSAMIGSPRK